MNLLASKNKQRDEDEIKERRAPRAQRNDNEDDASETWALPRWPELELYNRTRKQRKGQRLGKSGRAPRFDIVSVDEEEILELPPARPLVAVETSEADADVEVSGSVDDDVGDESKTRGRWNNHCEFLMSIISMSVGMGNFYRFPFVAYQNGGGVFVIPYLVILTFVGRPMYFMELAVGQFCSFGQVQCWEMSPFFRGVGLGSGIGSFCVVTYYSSVMGVTLYYLANSFRKTLPWAECDPSWATQEVCQQIIDARLNGTDPRTIVNLPQLYFEREVMKEKDNIDDGIGLPEWKQTLCLLASWIGIYIMIVKGVESSGKISYFLTIFPYVAIVVMLITSCTKEGSFEGMVYFISPDWKRILDPNIWFAAAGQCFFSLSTGFGPIINYASYSPFHHSIHKDTMIVSFMDTLASMLAGLTVFSTLGTLSHDLNKPIEEVVQGGPGLVFISFSDAISNFAYVPQLLSVLFFLMLLTLAIGSAVAWQMAAISVITDQFPKIPKFLISTVMCLAGFLIALIYVTPGGQWMLTLVDSFGGNINIYIVATLECIGIAWVYGVNNFCRDTEFMIRTKLSCFWKFCWGFVIPVLLTVVLIYSLATSRRLTYNGKEFPDIAILFGWTLTSISVLMIPIGAIYAIYKSSGSLKERFITSLKPTAKFGPRNPIDREQWELYKAGKIDLYGEPIKEIGSTDDAEIGDGDVGSTATTQLPLMIVESGSEILLGNDELLAKDTIDHHYVKSA